MADELIRAQLKITGRVQGVFYRANTVERARQLDLAGWVRNLPDGGVEAVAEGPRSRVEQLVAWCRQGPPKARVASVDAEWQPATGEFDAFEVRH